MENKLVITTTTKNCKLGGYINRGNDRPLNTSVHTYNQGVCVHMSGGTEHARYVLSLHIIR
ncbi:hypothetical protein DERF_007037 [Dermatophagoides farinae]|uniref:Uncharacterized protein n=1 Tax=Dermatophagoides farinae TaxID=6954 RepID=A0A922L5L4_DERFA|nr:hypothetical protein DERF_007037 [Dermatophagoides farinae]